MKDIHQAATTTGMMSIAAAIHTTMDIMSTDGTRVTAAGSRTITHRITCGRRPHFLPPIMILGPMAIIILRTHRMVTAMDTATARGMAMGMVRITHHTMVIIPTHTMDIPLPRCLAAYEILVRHEVTAATAHQNAVQAAGTITPELTAQVRAVESGHYRPATA